MDRSQQTMIGIVLGLVWSVAALGDEPVAKRAGAVTTFTGEITSVEWASPHTYFYVRTKDDAGQEVDWEIEAGPLPALIRGGLTRDMFQPGERVTVSGRVYELVHGDPERRFLRLDSITRHPATE